MIEMTLSSRHRIRNSSPGSLRPSTLPLGHGGSPQYWLSHVEGEETFFCFFQTAETGNRTLNSGVKGSGANHYPRAPAQVEKCLCWEMSMKHKNGLKWTMFFFLNRNNYQGWIKWVENSMSFANVCAIGEYGIFSARKCWRQITVTF